MNSEVSNDKSGCRECGEVEWHGELCPHHPERFECYPVLDSERACATSEPVVMESGRDSLPAVAGRQCLWSLREFAHHCRVSLRNEQEKPLPNNALIAVLCNAVRLAREHADSIAIKEQEELDDCD